MRVDGLRVVRVASRSVCVAPSAVRVAFSAVRVSPAVVIPSVGVALESVSCGVVITMFDDFNHFVCSSRFVSKESETWFSCLPGGTDMIFFGGSGFVDDVSINLSFSELAILALNDFRTFSNYYRRPVCNGILPDPGG